MWAFALEMVCGVICWRAYRGSRSLLAMIVLGNLANITLFPAAIPGPGQYLAGHPLVIVTVILVQIVATLALIDRLATQSLRAPRLAAEARGRAHRQRTQTHLDCGTRRR